MIMEFGLLAVAGIIIWLATDLMIEAAQNLTRQSRLSKLTISLFVIGAVTSLPEIGVSVNSVLLNSPQIALGNLIGTQILMLFGVIPLLAIVSQGLQLQTQLKNLSLGLTLAVVAVPMLALYNQSLELGEALIIILIYGIFMVGFSRQENLWERLTSRILPTPSRGLAWEMLKIGAGGAALLIASNVAVRELIELAAIFHTPRFLLSLIILPIATNLPELSLALRGLAQGQKTVALNDYLGALTFNSLLIAVLVFNYGGNIALGHSISNLIIAFAAGLGIFWGTSFSRSVLNTREGLLLLGVYLVLLAVAIGQITSAIFT